MRRWTEEDRKRQSELIKAHQPWKHSTGPKTAKGKYVSSKNATKHAMRSACMASLFAAIADYRKVRGQLVVRIMLKYAIQRHENKMADERTVMASWLSVMAGNGNLSGPVVISDNSG